MIVFLPRQFLQCISIMLILRYRINARATLYKLSFWLQMFLLQSWSVSAVNKALAVYNAAGCSDTS